MTRSASAHCFSPADENAHCGGCAEAQTQEEGGQTGAMEVDDFKAVVDVPDFGGLLIVPGLDTITFGRSTAHDEGSDVTGQIARHAAVYAY